MEFARGIQTVHIALESAEEHREQEAIRRTPLADEARPLEPRITVHRAPLEALSRPDPAPVRVEDCLGVARCQMVRSLYSPPVPAAMRPALPAWELSAVTPRAAITPLAEPYLPQLGPMVAAPEDSQPPAPALAAASQAPAAPPRGVEMGTRLVHLPEPEYPPACIRRGEQGLVLVEVHVLADGQVGDVHVVRGSGYAELDAAAVRSARKARFSPARRQGQTVDSWVVLPVRFVLK